MGVVSRGTTPCSLNGLLLALVVPVDVGAFDQGLLPPFADTHVERRVHVLHVLGGAPDRLLGPLEDGADGLPAAGLVGLVDLLVYVLCVGLVLVLLLGGRHADQERRGHTITVGVGIISVHLLGGLVVGPPLLFGGLEMGPPQWGLREGGVAPLLTPAIPK